MTKGHSDGTKEPDTSISVTGQQEHQSWPSGTCDTLHWRQPQGKRHELPASAACRFTGKTGGRAQGPSSQAFGLTSSPWSPPTKHNGVWGGISSPEDSSYSTSKATPAACVHSLNTPEMLPVTSNITGQAGSPTPVVVSSWSLYTCRRRSPYRVGVQAAQDLDQCSVHLLCRSLEEFPTTSHKQRVTCKGGATWRQDQTTLLALVLESSLLPSLSLLQLSRRFGESQATPLPHMGSALCKPMWQTQLLMQGAPWPVLPFLQAACCPLLPS